MLEAALKHPPDRAEQQMLEDYSQQRFQATPQTVLTSAQAQDLLNLLFSRRAERVSESETLRADSEINPQPIYNPLIPWLPAPLQPLAGRPVLATFIALLVVALLLYLLF